MSENSLTKNIKTNDNFFSLDDYYKQHVAPKQKFRKLTLKKNASYIEKRSHFARFHYIKGNSKKDQPLPPAKAEAMPETLAKLQNAAATKLPEEMLQKQEAESLLRHECTLEARTKRFKVTKENDELANEQSDLMAKDDDHLICYASDDEKFFADVTSDALTLNFCKD